MRQLRAAAFLLVALTLVLGASPASDAGAAVRALILPGVGIGPLTLGMRSMDVPRVLHARATPRVSGTSVVYDFPSLGLTSWATDDQVTRVRTRNKFHRLRNGINPTERWTDGILGMCSGIALSSPIKGGAEVTCPTIGVSFEIVEGRITAISVMPVVRARR